jgi:hypothetical protein
MLVHSSTGVISVLGRGRQEDYEFTASLDYMVRPCLNTKERREKNEKEQQQKHMVGICSNTLKSEKQAEHKGVLVV